MTTEHLSTEEHTALSLRGLDWFKNPSIKKEFKDSQAYSKYLINKRLEEIRAQENGVGSQIKLEPQTIQEPDTKPRPLTQGEAEYSEKVRAGLHNPKGQGIKEPTQAKPAPAMTIAEQAIYDWKKFPRIRGEFSSVVTYEAWLKSQAQGTAKISEGVVGQSWTLEKWKAENSQPVS